MAKKVNKPAPPKTVHQDKGKVKKDNPTAKVLKRQALGVKAKGKK